jgi:cysteinyl-tRNA synthetase
MPVYIYNSLTRKTEEFIPLKPPRVNIYTCGVTVYDESHIGHARSLYIFDVIRRYLQYRGFKLKFVRNITDIDDKIINRANELKIDWQDLVKEYIARYNQDLKLLGIVKADAQPRATENIPDMVKHIKGLIEKGYAYVTDSGVYFSVRKFKDYGKLSGQSIDSMRVGARIEPGEEKRDPLDFALWKKSKPDEPSWESPWGRGRPGWHIECSVMSQKFLNTDTLDIHAGGRDLIFPHHENEIAQAEALTDAPFAKYWIHHGLLTINGQKMAKSLGNFVTIKDFIAKYTDVDILKVFFLSAHYASPVDFTEGKILESKEALERILILLDKIERKIKGHRLQVIKKRFGVLEEAKAKFIEAMDEDFNTPKGLAAIFDLINLANKTIDESDFILSVKILLSELKNIFGLDLKRRLTPRDLEDSIKELIQRRNEERKKGNFEESDRIREQLEKKGIVLEDTKEGTIWRKKL